MRRKLLLFIVLLAATRLCYAQQDLGVTRITAPSSGCSLTNAEQVTIRVKNFSGSPFIGSMNVSYKVNASAPVNESTSVTILPGDSTTYTFTTTVNLSAPNTYSFKAYTSVVSDANPNNDTLSGYNVTCYPPTVGGSVSPNATVCSGANSGTLTLNGNTGSVLNWAYSTDGGNNWTNISNTGNTQPYLNLTTTTMYRVDVRSGTCPATVSSPATITVDPSPQGGTLAGIATVCAISNSGTISLSGYTGNIVSWEYSTDGGITWNTISNTTATENYNNLTTTTMYHAVVQMGNCISYSSSATITVSPATVGGTITGGTTVCSGTNGGTLVLTGNTGNVVRWESSVDNGSTWINISNTTNSQNYLNITATTIYRAVVQSGVCPQVISGTATVSVDPVSVGGMISGSALACNGSNSGTLTLNNYTGNVLKWESSTDNGVNWLNIVNTGVTQNYSNLTLTTWYRAIVKSGSCTSDTSSTGIVTVTPLPQANAGADTSVSLGYSVTLHGSGGITYSWTPSTGLSNASIAAPAASPASTTSYTLYVTDANGCTASDDVTVSVELDYNFAIMNLVTPNGDGKNDTWYIGNIEQYPSCEVTVFSMDDKKLFSASPYKNDWDGTYNGNALPDGTYYYVLKCPEVNKEFRGYITLLRNR